MLKMEVPYESAVLTLGIYPERRKKGIHTETCRKMFIAALSMIGKNGDN